MKIDSYAHIVPPRFDRRLRAILDQGTISDRVKLYGPWLDEDPVLCDLDARWRLLEPFEDYRQVLVLGAFPVEELGPPATTRELAREVNDELAELVRTYPDRFVGFAASVPLNDVDASLVEIDRAISELGANGILISTNIGGAPLDDPRFEPIFAKMAALDRPIWIHPTRSSVWPDYLTETESKYGIWWALGWPFETGAAMIRLVFSGRLESYPELKIITHHAGGMIPHFSGRLDSIQTEDQREAFENRFTRPALDYFRQFYVDSAMFGAPHAVRCSLEFFGPDHMLFGTDMPLGGPAVIPDTIRDIQDIGLPPEAEARIFSGNARRVLKLDTTGD